MKVIDFETTADKFLISIDKNAMNKESIMRVIKRLRQEYLTEVADIEESVIQKEYTEQEDNLYYSITNVYGVISQIGADTLESKPKIKIDGLDYFIFLTKIQDSEIRKYYRNPEKTIKFKIKQRKSVASQKVISAELMSFSVAEKGNFINSLSNIPPDTFSSFSK